MGLQFVKKYSFLFLSLCACLAHADQNEQNVIASLVEGNNKLLLYDSECPDPSLNLVGRYPRRAELFDGVSSGTLCFGVDPRAKLINVAGPREIFSSFPFASFAVQQEKLGKITASRPTQQDNGGQLVLSASPCLSQELNTSGAYPFHWVAVKGNGELNVTGCYGIDRQAGQYKFSAIDGGVEVSESIASYAPRGGFATWLGGVLDRLASGSYLPQRNATSSAAAIDKIKCTVNGKKLFGKIQFVTAFPDVTVEVVTALADLNVERVTSITYKCGEWEVVTAFPDLKVQIVPALADIKVQFVSAFPGLQ